jgi:hypothetical protein
LLRATSSELQDEVQPCSQTDLLSRASDMRSALILALLVAATQVSFLRSKASRLLIHRWPLQFSEGSGTSLELDKADLVQHVHVEDCFTSLVAKVKIALLQFSANCIAKQVHSTPSCQA